MIIREALQTELYDLSFLGEAFINRSISSKFISFHQTNFYSALSKMVETGIMKVWVAIENRRIIGAVSLITTPNLYNSNELIGDIYFIDVLPEYQGQGIAKKMMAVVEYYARDRGITALSIDFKSKEIADRICKSLDFTLIEYRLMKRMVN